MRNTILLLAATALLPVAASAAAINKADNADTLDLSTSWTGGAAPTSTGTAYFDAGVVTGTNRTTDLAADVDWGTIRSDGGTGAFAIDSATGNTVTLYGTTDASARLDAILLNSGTGASVSIGANLAIATNNVYFTSSRSLVISGNVNLGANTLKLFPAGTGALIEFDGVVSGTQLSTANAFFLDQGTGTGTVRLTNAGNTFTGNIELGGNGSGTRLEFTSAGALGGTTQIRFRNTGGTPGQGSILRYIGTTATTITQQLQCDTSIGIRIESDSSGGSLTLNGTWSQSNRPLYLGGVGTGDNTLAQNFTGTGALTKYGAGTWILSGTQGYSGTTAVNAGTLLVNGTKSGSGATTVAAGATLGGTGSVAGAITVNGNITGGTATTVGTFTAGGSVTLASGAALLAQIDSGALTADRLAITGALDLGGSTLTLTDLGLGTAILGQKLTLASYATITGTFANAADGQVFTLGANQWQLAYDDGGAMTITAVPEPSTYGLLGAGALAAMAFVKRRRRR